MAICVNDEWAQKILHTVKAVGAHQVKEQSQTLVSSDKADLSPVTEVDLYSHRKITDMLFGLDPQITILSEECTALDDFNIFEKEYFWCVDPLDGTRDYLEQSPHFAINIALFFKGKVQWGLIYHPHSQEFLISDRSQNLVYLIDANGEQRKINSPVFCDEVKTVLTSARVAMNAQRHEQITAYAPHLARDAKVLPVSSSFKFFLLIKQEAEAYVRKAPCMIWDIAPGFIAAELCGMSIYNLNTGLAFEWPAQALDYMPPFGIITGPAK
jgi:3'(2'), 5'-bisphosphate nucleotidase